MKKFAEILVLAIASMAALSSCAKENAASNDTTTPGTVIKASFEDMTKTALTSEYQVKWSEEDAIVAFDLEGSPLISSETTISDNGLVAEFSFAETIGSGYALFPADGNAVFDPNSGYISTTLPKTQYPVAGGFDPKANIALSKTVDGTAKFYNAGTLIGIGIKNDDIKKIVLRSDDALAGNCIVYMDDYPVEHPILESRELVNDDMILEADFVKGSVYYAVVFPKLYMGMNLTFTRSDGKVAEFTNDDFLDLTEGRNCITNIFDAEIPDEKWKAVEGVLFEDDFSQFDDMEDEDLLFDLTGSKDGFKYEYSSIYLCFGSGMGPNSINNTGDGCLKAGTSDDGGEVTLPKLGLKGARKAKVSFQFKSCETEETFYSVKIAGSEVTEFIVAGQETDCIKCKADDGWLNISFVFQSLFTDPDITFESNHFMIDNLKVETVD